MSDLELLENDEIVNARIESAEIMFEREFILSVWIGLDYGGTGQGFGGYALGGNPFIDCAMNAHENQTNLAADFISHILAIADVEKWSNLPGKIIRIRREEGWVGKIKGIGHPIKDRWYYPAINMKKLTS